MNTLCESLKALCGDVPYTDTVLSNASALLYDQVKNLNWAGFYLLKEGELWLGPFQGRPACVRIPVGRGVCGTAVREEKTLVVPDVHAFPGHIACDCASRSEIVVPLRVNGGIIGVMDLDSPLPDRFSPEDAQMLEEFAGVLCQILARL